jgi:hypothetical protein
MKGFKSIVLAVLAIFGVTASLFVHPHSVQAQASNSANSAALSITPKKNYQIEAGSSVDDKLTIRNLDTGNSLQLSLSVIDFTYTDDSGTPKLILDKDADPTTWSLRSYLKVPESVTVAPGSSKTVDMSVRIPSKLGAGSYYSAIMYSTGAPDGGNVGLSASGVTLVFVTVPGTVNEDLTVKNFGAYDSKDKKYIFMTSDEPTVIAYTLENKGNVTESPVGSIKLQDMFGHQYTISNVNPNKSLALIGQSRTFNSCIKLQSQDLNFQGSEASANTCTSAGLWPGYYTASLDLYYGQNGNLTKELTKTASFWYLPLWSIVALVIVLLVLAYIIWRIVRWFRAKFYGPKTPRSKSGRLARRR